MQNAKCKMQNANCKVVIQWLLQDHWFRYHLIWMILGI